MERPLVPAAPRPRGSAPRWSAFLVWPLAAGGSLVPVRDGRRILAAALRSSTGLPAAAGDGPPLPAVVGLLAVELAAERGLASPHAGGTIFTGLETGEPRLVPQVLRYPDVDVDAYLAPTPFVEHIGDPPLRDVGTARRPPIEKGYLLTQSPSDWPALAPTSGHALRAPRRAGLQPRAAPALLAIHPRDNQLSVFYNASVLNVPSVEDVRLLGRALLGRPEGWSRPSRAGRGDGRRLLLWELADASRRRPARGRGARTRRTLEMRHDAGFDPATVDDRGGPDVFATLGDARFGADRRTVYPPSSIRLDPDGGCSRSDAFDPGWRAGRRP